MPFSHTLSGRVGIVDINNLKALDPDTKNELLQEYHEAHRYLFDGSNPVLEHHLNEQFIRRKNEQLTDPLAYYDAHIDNSQIFRLVITHPDMDHMSGIHRLHEQEASKSIVNFWHTGEHDFNLRDCTDEDWENSPYDKRDWETYKKLRSSVDEPKSLQRYQGQTGDFWTQDGVEIWAPTPELEELAVEKDQPNIISMVLKISYKGRSIVLGGDATAEETWPTIYPHLDMKDITVLKASHHGRKTGYYRPAVKEMSPWLTITSVGEKAYDATENYRRYSQYTVSLRQAGDICITIEEDGRVLYSPNTAEHWKPKKT